MRYMLRLHRMLADATAETSQWRTFDFIFSRRKIEEFCPTLRDHLAVFAVRQWSLVARTVFCQSSTAACSHRRNGGERQFVVAGCSVPISGGIGSSSN